MTVMPLQPFTAAETAHLARIEAAPTVDAGQDARVETVARAIYNEDRDGGHFPPWDGARNVVNDDYRRLASAALAAMHPADEALRDVLRVHHPIMRSETGPFSGCRCGQVGLGQDVIAHVVGNLRAVLGGEQ